MMELVEVVLIAKMGFLDDLVGGKQMEMESMINEPLNVQADFLFELIRQAINEVEKVEFDEGGQSF